MKQTNLVTTEGLKKELTALEERLDQKLQMYLRISKLDTQVVINQAVEKFVKEMRHLRSEMMTRFDHVVGEIATLKEENIIANHHSRELREDVKKLKRVTGIKSN